jgi:hypothetical protein
MNDFDSVRLSWTLVTSLIKVDAAHRNQSISGPKQSQPEPPLCRCTYILAEADSCGLCLANVNFRSLATMRVLDFKRLNVERMCVTLKQFQ